MTNTTGYRRGTRYMFSQKFRKHGNPAVTTFQHVYKRGQIVDVKANASQQKGKLCFQCYIYIYIYIYIYNVCVCECVCVCVCVCSHNLMDGKKDAGDMRCGRG